jgi:hypothetical protein
MPKSQAKLVLSVAAVADVQGSLHVVRNDLQRLGGLLDHATENLMQRFSVANQTLSGMGAAGSPELGEVRNALQHAVTELQFHDMASQLLVHTDKILNAIGQKLAEEGSELVAEYGQHHASTAVSAQANPVTQSEMDAGSVELF